MFEEPQLNRKPTNGFSTVETRFYLSAFIIIILIYRQMVHMQIKYKSRMYLNCVHEGKMTSTNLCVYPLLHVHGSTCHVIDLVLDVRHRFVCAPDDTHNGNL